MIIDADTGGYNRHAKFSTWYVTSAEATDIITLSACRSAHAEPDVALDYDGGLICWLTHPKLLARPSYEPNKDVTVGWVESSETHRLLQIHRQQFARRNIPPIRRIAPLLHERFEAARFPSVW